MTTPPFTGRHSWEVFEHVANPEMGWMPAAIEERMKRGAEAGDAPVDPRPSATVVPIRRQGHTGWEVWMMRRRAELKFGGVWAFPGGALEESDHAAPDPLRACAVRELAEETGCDADPAQLHLWARWITPEVMPFRFDTWFYLWALPDGVEPVAGDVEATEGRWVRGLHLVEDVRRDEDPSAVTLMPPTRAVLAELTMLGDFDEVLAVADSREVEPVTPRFVRDGEAWRSSYPLRSGQWQ